MAAENMKVTSAGAGNKDGSDWANAFDIAEWHIDMNDNAEPGDKYFVMGGQDYTRTANYYIERDGDGENAISVIGVKPGTTAEAPTYADWAYGNDRPKFIGNYRTAFGTGYATGAWLIRNMQAYGNYPFMPKPANIFVNCKAECPSNWGISAWKTDFVGYTLINCEGITPGVVDGVASFAIGNGCILFGCHAYGSAIGFRAYGRGTSMIGCIASDCTVSGIDVDSMGVFINNTIYDCPIGLKIGAGAESSVFYNNNIVGCVVGAQAATEMKSCIWDYNNWYDNDTDVVNVSKGLHATALDPQFADPDNKDFTIGNASMKGLGIPYPDENVGLKAGVRNYIDQGALQREEVDPDFPVVGDVEKGVSYDDGNKIGTFKEPGIANVRLGEGYGAGDTEFSGTLDLPSINDVEKGVQFDGLSKTGVFKVPLIINVRLGEGYGANDIEFSGLLDLPSIDDVRKDIQFDSTTKTGKLDLPSIHDVEKLVKFDQETKTGDFVSPLENETKKNTEYGYDGEFIGTMDIVTIVEPLDIEVNDGTIAVEVTVE